VLLRILLEPLRISFTGLSPSMAALSRAFYYRLRSHIEVLQPRKDKSLRFGLVRFRSPLLTESLRFLFLRLLRCFSSAGSPCMPMYSACNNWLLHQLGFPIRRSPDQSVLTAPRSLSQLCHVLHRLLSPRHPPVALKCLYPIFAANMTTCAMLSIRRLFHPQSWINSICHFNFLT
jgi:hypothetical protein